jgi:hypothetical protein
LVVFQENVRPALRRKKVILRYVKKSSKPNLPKQKEEKPTLRQIFFHRKGSFLNFWESKSVKKKRPLTQKRHLMSKVKKMSFSEKRHLLTKIVA